MLETNCTGHNYDPRSSVPKYGHKVYQVGSASKHLIDQQPQYSAVRNIEPVTDGPTSNSPFSTAKAVWSDYTMEGKQSEGISTRMDYKTARITWLV